MYLVHHPLNLGVKHLENMGKLLQVRLVNVLFVCFDSLRTISCLPGLNPNKAVDKEHGKTPAGKIGECFVCLF